MRCSMISFLLHFASELARDDGFDRGRGDLLADFFFIQPALEARA
jgi:hypothetical protein